MKDKVLVLSPSGKPLNYTTLEKARRSVRQQRACWVDRGTIRLKMMKQDRLRMYDQVIRESGYICGICGQPVDPAEATIDHIIPLSRGGTDARENLMCAHRRCNELKGNLTLEEFKAMYGKEMSLLLYGGS